MIDWPEVGGAVSVKLVGPELMPIFMRGVVASAASEPKGEASSTPRLVMLPGPTVTVRLAGAVGKQTSPSITVVEPSVACAKKPNATIALR